MKGWKKKCLADVADFCLGKMLDQNKNRGEPLPYLANINVRWGEFDLDDLREMRFEEHERERYELRHGDIVMCEGGEPGRCAMWKEQRPGMMFQKALHRIRPHEVLENRFLFYSLLHMGQTGCFTPLFTGATIKHFPREKLAKVEVHIPPLPIQQRIADILSAYDDLIENNRRRIQLLEQAARLLYQEWFVRLRFPGHEHVKVVEGVPEGWARTSVAEATSFLARGITPKYDDEAPGLVINQKCIRDRMVNLEPARHQAKEAPPDKLVRFGDVLINSTGEGTLGRVAQIQVEVPNCTVDSHVTIARPAQGVPLHLFGMHLTGLESFIATLGRGATNQTELSRDAIGELSLLLPPSSLAQAFEDVATPIFRQIRILSEQNAKLRQARDLLLPRLMNGETAV